MNNFPKAKRGVVQVKTVAAGLFQDKAWRKRQVILQDNFFFLYKPDEVCTPCTDLYVLLSVSLPLALSDAYMAE
jgi:hypothetical protein